MNTLLVTLFTVYLIHSVVCEITFNEGECEKYWTEFKEQYNKNYTNTDEDKKREDIFKKNLKEVIQHNIQYFLGHTTYTRTLNFYSDLNEDDYSPRYNGYRSDANNTANGTMNSAETIPPDDDITTKLTPQQKQYYDNINPRLLHYEYTMDDGRIMNIPYMVDWREYGAVTPVKDQGGCNGCWAFVTTGALEAQMKIKTGQLVSLSEQNLVDCVADNSACAGGWMDTAYEYVQYYGLDTEYSYPYKGKKSDTCEQKKGQNYATCRGYVRIPYGDEVKLMVAVASVGPVSATVDGSLDSFRTYNYGIYQDSKCQRNSFNHAVLIIGYGTVNGLDYWLLKNSYGSSWGMEGYMKIARNKNNMCGIASGASYPLV